MHVIGWHATLLNTGWGVTIATADSHLHYVSREYIMKNVHTHGIIKHRQKTRDAVDNESNEVMWHKYIEHVLQSLLVVLWVSLQERERERLKHSYTHVWRVFPFYCRYLYHVKTNCS